MSLEMENNTRFGARGCSWIADFLVSRNIAVHGTKLIWALGRLYIDAVLARYVWIKMHHNQQNKNEKGHKLYAEFCSSPGCFWLSGCSILLPCGSQRFDTTMQKHRACSHRCTMFSSPAYSSFWCWSVCGCCSCVLLLVVIVVTFFDFGHLTWPQNAFELIRNHNLSHNKTINTLKIHSINQNKKNHNNNQKGNKAYFFQTYRAETASLWWLMFVVFCVITDRIEIVYMCKQ